MDIAIMGRNDLVDDPMATSHDRVRPQDINDVIHFIGNDCAIKKGLDAGHCVNED